jgi:predicted DNA binding CopG/RHH family protein
VQDRLSPVIGVQLEPLDDGLKRLTTFGGLREMRDELRINGIDNALKQELKAAALDHVGNENISQFVRFIIADFLAKNKEIKKPDIDFSSKKIRVELKLPEDCLKEIEQLAELKLSTRNYYLNSIIFQHLGQPQLYGDEIETLRRSNYQVAKI